MKFCSLLLFVHKTGCHEGRTGGGLTPADHFCMEVPTSQRSWLLSSKIFKEIYSTKMKTKIIKQIHRKKIETRRIKQIYKTKIVKWTSHKGIFKWTHKVLTIITPCKVLAPIFPQKCRPKLKSACPIEYDNGSQPCQQFSFVTSFELNTSKNKKSCILTPVTDSILPSSCTHLFWERKTISFTVI